MFNGICKAISWTGWLCWEQHGHEGAHKNWNNTIQWYHYGDADIPVGSD